MKNKLLLVLFCFISFIIYHPIYSQWEKTNDFQGLMNASVLTDSNNIWGGGYSGQLYNYDISNEQFNYYSIGSPFDIFSAAQINDSVIAFVGTSWTSGHRGFIIRFNTRMNEINDTTFIGAQAWDLTFIDQDTGFVSGYGYILGTTDGGNVWDTVFDFPSHGFDVGAAYSITHDDQHNLYASGTIINYNPSSTRGIVIKSEDKGLSWKVLYDEKNYVKLKNIGVLDSDPQIIYCNDLELNLYISYNGGDDWIQRSIPMRNTILDVGDILFQDKDTVFVVINQRTLFDPMAYTENMILRSADGGNSWMIQYHNQPKFPPQDSTLNIIISSESTFYCLGWNLFLSTKNGGGDGPILNLEHSSEQPEKIEIYPNPAMDFIELADMNLIETCTIYNSNGIIVRRVKSHFHNQLYVGDLLPGIYFIKIIDRNRKLTSQTLIKL